MNVLLCVGCDKYESLRPLRGAEIDATRVFRTLTTVQGNAYSHARSRLLLSPHSFDITAALNELCPQDHDIDVFTLFFAGHGVVSAGSFFLCTRETVTARCSISAYSLASFFQSVNEVQPRQVNVIIDACQAGGSSFDLTTLCKTECIGQSTSSSIAFLGACSANEYAQETDDGGVLTTEFIRCLTGEYVITEESPALDLITVGAFLSPHILQLQPDQRPISWGLNLFGTGFLTENPHFSQKNSETTFNVQNISPNSDVGRKIREISPQLWEEYRAIENDPQPRRLLSVIELACRKCVELPQKIAVVHGLAETLRIRSRASSEGLAASQCLVACALALLPDIDTPEASASVRGLIRIIMEEGRAAWRNVNCSVENSPNGLLNANGVLAELFYLPLRLTKVLGWLGSSILVSRLVPDCCAPDESDIVTLAKKIAGRHIQSFASVSDEQGASLYAFLRGFTLAGAMDLAADVVDRHFADFAEKRGNIAPANLDGEQAYRYIASLTDSFLRPTDWKPATPSHLLPVLLRGGDELGFCDSWCLEAVDRQHTNFFLANNYRDFGRKIIENGNNISHHIGFGVWSLVDYRIAFQKAVNQHFDAHPFDFPPEGLALAILASQVFPDRIPFFLERLNAKLGDRLTGVQAEAVAG